MPTLSLTIAGLSALIIREDLDSAAAVLMKHPKHDHYPFLLIPKSSVADDKEVAKYYGTDVPRRLARARLPRPLADYYVYDVTGIDLSVTNTPSVAKLELRRTTLPESGCPDKGTDWTSLDWLLDLAAVSGRARIILKKGELKKSTDIATMLPIGHGKLSGSAPVEITRKIRKYSYDRKTTPRAVTDAAIWTTTVEKEIEIEFAARGGASLGTLKLKGNVNNALLLNLPDPDKQVETGGHLHAFQKLPFDDGTMIKSVAEIGSCRASQQAGHESVEGTSADHGLTITVTTTGPRPGELAISATVRYGCDTTGDPADDTQSHDGAHSGLIPLGDSLCMKPVVYVPEF